jgi:hypothetical protein
MFSNTTYQNRRQQLASEIKKGYVLIAEETTLVPRNYKGNPYRFRQDSNFLLFCGY